MPKLSENPGHWAIHWAESSEWLLVPQQSRTRKSLTRIIEAAVALFCEHGYDQTSIGDIARLAKVSVSGIYARFPDKQALLYTVIESYQRTRLAQHEDIVARQRAAWAAGEHTAAQAIDFYLAIIISGFQQDALLIRLVERERMRDPVVAGLAAAMHDRVVQSLAEILAPHAAELGHPDIAGAARFIHATVYGLMALEILHQIQPTDRAHDIFAPPFEARVRQLVFRFFSPVPVPATETDARFPAL